MVNTCRLMRRVSGVVDGVCTWIWGGGDQMTAEGSVVETEGVSDHC